MGIIIIISFALIGNLIMFFLPISKSKKAAIYGIISFALVIIILAKNAENYAVPAVLSPKAQIALADKCGKTIELTKTKTASLETPFEATGGLFAVLSAVMAFFALMTKTKNEEETKEVYLISLTFSAIATLYLLSLYAGLELCLVAWIKDRKELVKRPLVTID